MQNKNTDKTASGAPEAPQKMTPPQLNVAIETVRYVKAKKLFWDDVKPTEVFSPHLGR
jgi:hypothetical protein